MIREDVAAAAVQWWRICEYYPMPFFRVWVRNMPPVGPAVIEARLRMVWP